MVEANVLIVRQEQLDALAAPLIADVQQLCFNYICQERVLANQSEVDVLQEAVEHFVREAGLFGFRLDSSICEYVRICVRYRTDRASIVADDRLKKILGDVQLHETEKLYLISRIAAAVFNERH